MQSSQYKSQKTNTLGTLLIAVVIVLAILMVGAHIANVSIGANLHLLFDQLKSTTCSTPKQ